MALRSLHVAVTMSQVGVSLVYDKVREELCFAELSQLAIGFQERGERQKFLLRIADIQVDNQMENARKPVLLANRGGGSQAGADEDVRLCPLIWGLEILGDLGLFSSVTVSNSHALSLCRTPLTLSAVCLSVRRARRALRHRNHFFTCTWFAITRRAATWCFVECRWKLTT